MRRSKGFTLIEILVTLSIMAIIAGAIFSTLAGGINVYKRVKTLTGERADILLSLEKLEEDLNNVFIMSGIGFTGDAKKVVFPKLISASCLRPGEDKTPLGKASYYFDDRSSALFKEEQGYARAVSKSNESECAPERLASVKDLTFSYYYFDAETKGYEWRDSWSAENSLPLGVKIEATFNVGLKSVKVKRIVFIPIAG